MKRQPTADEMLLRMAGLCAASEQCVSDIRAKVLKKGFSPEVADRIIDYLVSNRYIDEVRYAKAFTADKVRFSCWGRIKIRMHLRAKHVDDSSISEGLLYIDEKQYAESLGRVLEAKARTLDMSEIADRRKLYRHLASRGYESSLIVQAIRNYLKKASASGHEDD